MVKKNCYQYDVSSNGELDPISRSQKKRDSTAIQDVGEALVLLAPAKWDVLGVGEELREALMEFKNVKSKEAKRRQIQYIGRRMREQCEADIKEGKKDIMTTYTEMHKYL